MSPSGSPLPPVVSPTARSTIEGLSGTHTLSVPVTLTAPSALPISVHWATSNGTATAPDDYTSASGNLAFAPGETTRERDDHDQG